MYSLRTVAPRALLRAQRSAPVSVAARRSWSATAMRADPEKQVPVHIYSKGEPAGEKVLSFDDSKSSIVPSAPATPDESKPAFPLKKTTTATLPPTMQKFTLHDKVAIVTGAARGLGNNIAKALCEVGVKGLAILDVQQDLGDAAAAELSQQVEIPVHFYKVDVRDAAGVTEVVNNVVQTFGSIDVLVNAAGIADSNIKAEEYDTEKFRRLIDINLTGSFLVAQACGRHMISAGNGGSMVLVASMSGSVVNYPQEQSCYNASKAAVIQLGKSLAAEWAQHNIRVNCISPGYMDTALNRVPALDAQKKIWTSLTPQRRLGNVDELNNLAVFLSSDASTFMTGANCVIDGGYSVY